MFFSALHLASDQGRMLLIVQGASPNFLTRFSVCLDCVHESATWKVYRLVIPEVLVFLETFCFVAIGTRSWPQGTERTIDHQFPYGRPVFFYRASGLDSEAEAWLGVRKSAQMRWLPNYKAVRDG